MRKENGERTHRGLDKKLSGSNSRMLKLGFYKKEHCEEIFDKQGAEIWILVGKHHLCDVSGFPHSHSAPTHDSAVGFRLDATFPTI